MFSFTLLGATCYFVNLFLYAVCHVLFKPIVSVDLFVDKSIFIWYAMRTQRLLESARTKIQGRQHRQTAETLENKRAIYTGFHGSTSVIVLLIALFVTRYQQYTFHRVPPCACITSRYSTPFTNLRLLKRDPMVTLYVGREL